MVESGEVEIEDCSNRYVAVLLSLYVCCLLVWLHVITSRMPRRRLRKCNFTAVALADPLYDGDRISDAIRTSGVTVPSHFLNNTDWERIRKDPGPKKRGLMLDTKEHELLDSANLPDAALTGQQKTMYDIHNSDGTATRFTGNHATIEATLNTVAGDQKKKKKANLTTMTAETKDVEPRWKKKSHKS